LKGRVIRDNRGPVQRPALHVRASESRYIAQ